MTMDMHRAPKALMTGLPSHASKPLEVLFAKVGQGQRKGGVEQGPDHLWQGGVEADLRASELLSEVGISVSDHEAGLLPALATLADEVERSLTRDRRVLTLGGDHSIALSTIEGVLRVYPDARILYVDAHGDINTPESSPSGNLHGMPLAAHFGMFSQREVPGIGFVGTRLRANQIAFIGVRDLDPSEASAIDDRNIPCYTADDVREFGMRAVIRQVMNEIDPEGAHPIHISFDVDSVDPEVAPATGVPVPGGLTIEDLDALAAFVSNTRRLVALDLAEVNPALAQTQGDVDRTIQVASRFAAHCLV